MVLLIRSWLTIDQRRGILKSSLVREKAAVTFRAWLRDFVKLIWGNSYERNALSIGIDTVHFTLHLLHLLVTRYSCATYSKYGHLLPPAFVFTFT